MAAYCNMCIETIIHYLGKMSKKKLMPIMAVNIMTTALQTFN